MITSLATNRVLETLDDLILGKKVFTAYDVTLAARAGTDENIDHDDVRNIITDQFVTGHMPDYNKDSRVLDLLSNKPHAIVFFPDGTSADDHACVTAPTTIVAVDDTSTDSDAVDALIPDDGITSTDTFDLTKEGRVNVPKTMLDKVTPTSGSYDILVQGSLKCVTANKDGRVRIGVRKFGVIGDKVNITVDTVKNMIEIVTA